MIIQERYTLDGKEAIRSFSDNGVKIHGGFPEGDYDEACDLAESGRTYIETDIPIEADEQADKAEAYDILIGGAE